MSKLFQKQMDIVNDSSLSPFPSANAQARCPQSPDLLTNNSTTTSLYSTPGGLLSDAHSHTHCFSIDLLEKVNSDGLLDLSGKQLVTLTDGGGKRKGHDGGKTNRDQQFATIRDQQFATIHCLNIAQNSLRSLDCANLPLQQCAEIDASQNELSQIRCFSPLADSLAHLNLSDNRITSLGSLNSFCRLETLDLSHNRIEHFPILDQLSRLRRLNLASNQIKAVPNLSRLTSLVELDLHGNSIHTLDSVRNFLPKSSLRSLDVGGNLVSDLCEFNHLYNCGLFLNSLTVICNPCTRADDIGQRTFSYRPFIYSCVLGDLKMLDGSLLSEQEILKGENLHIQGRSLSFRAAHDQLCAYLEQQCPLEDAEDSLLEDKKLAKVIQKRREYNRSQSSSIITAKIGDSAMKMNEQKTLTIREGTKPKTPESRQKTLTGDNRNRATTPTNGGRTNAMKTAGVKVMTAAASGILKGETGDRGEDEQQTMHKQTPIVRISKSVAQLVSNTTNTSENEQPSPKERSHSAMDGYETIRTVSTLVQPPGSPTHTVILSRNSLDSSVHLDFSKNESNDEQSQQQHKLQQSFPLLPPSPTPFSPSAVGVTVFLPPLASQMLPLPSSSSVSSPLSSRIPVNISSLTARSLRQRQFSTLQKSSVCQKGDTTIQQQKQLHQQKKSLRTMPSSSLSTTAATADHRCKFGSNSERKVGALRRKNTVEHKEESGCSSKGSRKKGRFSNLARKFNIRKKSSTVMFPTVSAPQNSSSTLQGKVDELAKQNKLLTGINEEHVQTFQEMVAKIKQMEVELSDLRKLLIPTPANLICKRHEDIGKGNDVVDITWENVIPLMNAVDSYELFLDGHMFDQTEPIKAKSRRLRITDLNPAQDIKVAIRAVSSLMAVRSATTEMTVSKRCVDDEGKENKNNTQTMDKNFRVIK